MYENLLKLIQQAETADRIGKIENVVGMSMEASGGRSGIGDIVMIYNEAENCQVPAEVVGFKNGKIQLMTYENISGITAHDKRMNDCLPPILFSAIFKLLKVLPDTELDAC